MALLELKDISYSYNEKTPVLSHVSLSVDKGQRVALSAPSGFGKSTLCKIAAGFLEPDAGTVLFNGVPLPKRGVCPIQMIWQHPEHAIDPLITIRSSLEEAGSLDFDLLKRVGVREEWLSRYPRELSGGELQRCCVARALRVKPEFIIADEISTMLDAITQVQIWETLLSYAEEANIGMLLVTHSDALTKRIATDVFELA
ncbi:MAG: ABC transporter ATP-binding protein [Anaerotardibacter sp.]